MHKYIFSLRAGIASHCRAWSFMFLFWLSETNFDCGCFVARAFLPCSVHYSWLFLDPSRLQAWLVLDKKQECKATSLFLTGFITVETIVGLTCPLTVLENMFRDVDYSSSFISYWMAQILYWNLPSEVFVLLYSLCLAWVLILWKVCPPIQKMSDGL